MTSRWLSFFVLALLVACSGAKAPAHAQQAQRVEPPDASAVAPASPAEQASAEVDVVIPIGPRDAVRGRRLARITIVLFSDFQCPFCARVEPTLRELLKDYGDDLRIVWKNQPLPFHEHARLAAEIGQGVLETKGQEAFWRFHDTVFANASSMNPESLRAWAALAGADGAAIDAGLSKKAWSAKIDDDIALANRVDATGTPTAFVNGVIVVGAQPYSKWKTVIDTELAKANQAIAEGTARDRVYRVLTTKNFEAGPPKDDQDEEEKDTRVWHVPVAGAPTRGPANALVTIVEFGDFQCPYCKGVQPVLEQIRSTYGDKVRMVWKDRPLPMHPRANPAAQLARFARGQKGDNGFWDVHAQLFDSQPHLEDADLEAIAKKAGLNVGKAMSAVEHKAFQKAIEADENLAEDVLATGIPSFFINGRRLTGAQPFEKFKTVIDREMANAEQLVQRGVAEAAVYDTIIRDGEGAPEQKTVAPPAARAPFMGAANGKVVIQGWSDFQCPFCARVEPTLEALVKAYPTQVKIIWRDKPLSMHPDAALAAQAAREAFAQKGNAGFAKMRKLLFDNQRTEGGLKRPALESYAKQIGLDLSKFNKALDNETHKAVVDSDDVAAANAGINGTPSFLIGPYFTSGAQPLRNFKRLVERVLSPPQASKKARL
ncbi:MAG: thioredoxin domain-containing protein [Polyangiaceae bacterium]|nr:thioredoxin domain-containing protein [Polyangiaceae bacterium]